jgi:hypothetical protein
MKSTLLAVRKYWTPALVKYPTLERASVTFGFIGAPRVMNLGTGKR